MSDLNEKLERPGPSVGTKARATRAQLERRLGCLGFDGAEPQEVCIVSMGKAELWKRVSGSGLSAVFELQDELKN